MRGFGNVASAARFCRAFDEVRQFFRVRTTVKQKVSLAQQREVFRQRLDPLKTLALVVSWRKACGRAGPAHFLRSCVLSSDRASS